MPCGSADIQGLLRGNEKRAFFKGLKIPEAGWTVGNPLGNPGLSVNPWFPNLSVRQSVNALPRSLQQYCCQHERCKKQTFPWACFLSPLLQGFYVKKSSFQLFCLQRRGLKICLFLTCSFEPTALKNK